MAEITVDTAHRKEQLRKQLGTALAAYRAMLDTFVTNRMRQSATEADYVRPRTPPAAPFQPIDPAIVNDSIPAFFIGRNRQGFWVARDVHGRIGGIFLLESSAIAFARSNSLPAGCATIYPSERFELDLENNGNPLVAHLAALMRLLMRLGRRVADIAGR